MELFDELNGEAGTAGHEIPVRCMDVEMVAIPLQSNPASSFRTST